MSLKQFSGYANGDTGSELGGDTTTVHFSPLGRVESFTPACVVLMLEEMISCEKSRKSRVNLGNQKSRNRGQKKNKPGTGTSLHTQEPVTVASFRTWRGWRENVA